MNKTLVSGLVLIGLGILLVVLSTVEFTSREEVLRVGDFRATATTKKRVPGLRWVGVALVVGGAVVSGVGFKQGRK